MHIFVLSILLAGKDTVVHEQVHSDCFAEIAVD